MQNSDISNHPVTTAPSVDDAVGVASPTLQAASRFWCVAVVGRNTEIQCRERLQKSGYESFVASQEELHRWANGKKKVVERVIIPAKIFIRLSEQERREVVKESYINYFLTNRALTNAYGGHPIAHIPDHEIEMLRFILCHADVPVDFVPHVCLGDRIRVIRGSLRGFEGRITRLPDGNTYAVACLDALGCALMKIDPQNLEVI